jgi:hypothetical protein
LCFQFSEGDDSTDSIVLTRQLLDEDHVTLAFDKAALSAFHMLAQSRGMRVDQMIGDALADLFSLFPDTGEDWPPYN